MAKKQIKSAIRKKILSFVAEAEDKLNATLANFLFRSEFDFQKFRGEVCSLRDQFLILQNEGKKRNIDEAGVFIRLQKIVADLATLEARGEDYRKALDFASNFRIEMHFDESKLLDLITLETPSLERILSGSDIDGTQLLTESFSKCSYKEELFRQMSATSANDVVETVNKVIEFPDLRRHSPPPETSNADVKTPKNENKKQSRTLFNSGQGHQTGSFVIRPNSGMDSRNGPKTGENARSINGSSRPSFIFMEKGASPGDSKGSDINAASRSKNSFFKHEPKKEPQALTLERKNIGIYKSLSNLSKHSSPRLTTEEKGKGGVMPPRMPQTPSKLAHPIHAANVSNLQIDSTKMRKIIFTLINAKEKVTRINFRNNTFVCEPITLLLEIFKLRHDIPLVIDFSANPPDSRFVLAERDRAELRKLNVEVIV